MSAKTHFVLSPEPLDFSKNLPMSGLCGKLVSRPRPEVMWEVSQRGLPEFNSLRDCAKCVQSAEFREPDTNSGYQLTPYYLYGIVEGEEQEALTA